MFELQSRAELQEPALLSGIAADASLMEPGPQGTNLSGKEQHACTPMFMPSLQSAEVTANSSSDKTACPDGPASCDSAQSASRTVLPNSVESQSVSTGNMADQSRQEACVGQKELFPQRPGQVLCDFYVRTGYCKFGQGCKFDHPLQYAVKLNSLGLPLRSSEPACPFYAKTGGCKFGPSCKFHHPERSGLAV